MYGTTGNVWLFTVTNEKSQWLKQYPLPTWKLNHFNLNPYVDPVDIVQADFLDELQATGEDETLDEKELEIKSLQKDVLIV